MTALHDLSADTLSSAYRAGQLSPVEVTRAALARIDAWEGKINAMHVITADEALAQAASAEARWRAGQGVKSAQEQEKHNVYRVDPKSGDIKVVVDDFVEPNGHCFAPDEKKLYVIDTGFTDGPDNPSHIRVFDVDHAAGKVSNSKVFAEMPKPSITDGVRCDTDGNVGAPWAGATPTRMVFVATTRLASSSARSISRRRSPICASAARSETGCTSAARRRSTRSIRVRPAQ